MQQSFLVSGSGYLPDPPPPEYMYQNQQVSKQPMNELNGQWIAR
jgi:hypothetical protein